MKILKANKIIEGYLTQSINVKNIDYGHSVVDALGYEKLVERIAKDGMVWPIIIHNGLVKFGNKRLMYARVYGYDEIDAVVENDISNLDKLGDMTRIK